MLKKIVGFLVKKVKNTVVGNSLDSFKQYSPYIQIANSTILLHDSSIRINSLHPEKRKYVTIGQKGLNRAHFIFESEQGEVIIGDNVHLGGVTFISRNKIIVKDNVTMAWDVTLYDHNSHSIYWSERAKDNETCYKDYQEHQGNTVVTKDWSCVKDAPIIIESKVWIGFSVLILKGVTIGEGAVVAAKSVVTKDVPAWTVVAGNPAQVVKIIPADKRS
jgi:galactoside O-acetyltransferase